MDTMRAYLVIPKLVAQPTWGGDYIVKTKSWEQKADVGNLRIGQSYELYSGSNLSLFSSSADPAFSGEITDAVGVAIATNPENSISLLTLIETNPVAVLGNQNASQYQNAMHLLIKFTQALGNSFQLHIKDGANDPKWKPKPESWYFFEPGFITLGVKPFIDWNVYQHAVSELHAKITALSAEVVGQKKTYESARETIKQLLHQYDPWQYVNVLYPEKEALIDLSPGGIHHSWEEDANKFPLGNVVYELQVDVLDSVCTIRNFDKGKMAKDGSIRPLHIEDYFKYIDRTPEANLPQNHIAKSQIVVNNSTYMLDRLLKTKYYTLDKLTFKTQADFSETITGFRHVFVKVGAIELVTNEVHLTIAAGHSAFVPAAVGAYGIRSKTINTVVLISY